MAFIPTVFVMMDKIMPRWTIAGYAYDREHRPIAPIKTGEWLTNADNDWKEQIDDFIARFPIATVWIKLERRPLVEYDVATWLKQRERYQLVDKVELERIIPRRS